MYSKKIFIGSSSEALRVSEHVEEIIRAAGMIPVSWNKLFPAGNILLETIEKIPLEVDGAILLATPDVKCIRGEEQFSEPVANIIFEYGFLSARLTRKKVAICIFEGTKIPSDLEGLTIIPFGNYEKNTNSNIPEKTIKKLIQWLDHLPDLAEGISPIASFHGYSGRWHIENRFSRWRDIELKENQRVYFEGNAFILIPIGGSGGTGKMIGQLYVSTGQYTAEYKIANQILDAAVDDHGTLKMRIEVINRELIKEEGEVFDERFRGELFGSKTFDVILMRVSDAPKELRGKHEYRVASQVHSESEEIYRYLG